MSGINRTGRTIKIQLRGKNYLHIAKVQAYGTPINYSTTMETPVVGNLITRPMDLAEETSKKFHHDSVPYIGKNNSMSISMFVSPKAGNTGRRNIVAKGSLSIMMDSGTIGVGMATTTGSELISANTKLDANSWNHVVVSIKPSVSPASGWLYGEFSSKPAGITEACCYIVHPQRGEYYRLKEQGKFAAVTKNKWSASVVKGMKYLGELTENIATVTIYMNGNLDQVHKLDGDIKLSNGPLIIGQNSINPNAIVKGMIGQIHGLKMYNYDISKETAQRDSKSQHKSQTLDLMRQESDGGKQKVVSPNVLPTIKNEVSVSFWVKIAGGLKKYQSIFINGTSQENKTFGMWVTPEDKLYSSVKTYGGSASGDGVKEINFKLKSDVWYNVAMVIKGKNQAAYINGKRVASVELPGDVEYTVAPVIVGGFAGKVKNFKYHNHALSLDEVKGHMGVHPDYRHQNAIQKIWHEQGCVTDLYKNPEANSDLVALMKSGNETAVETRLKNIRILAHKGDANKLKMCYGPYASELFAKLQKSGKLLNHSLEEKQGKKCLPTAPFNCKDRSVNDFDIRTHKDFHKYTLTERIIPPVQSLTDFKITEHPDFAKYQSQLNKSKEALDELTKLRVETEEKNKSLMARVKDIEAKTGLTQEDVLKHPAYVSLQNKFKEESTKLGEITKQQVETATALQKANQEVEASTIRDVSSDPEFKRIAAELKNARKLAAANIAQTMDFDTIRRNPVFREILKEVMNNAMGENLGEDSMSESLVALERDLRTQKAQLDKMRDDTLQQLKNTKQLASDIFHGIAGLDSATVDNIIASKEDLSGNPEYQKIIASMKKYGANDFIKQHPEYQKLANKLNQMTTAQVDGEGQNYQGLKVQASKCAAMFDDKMAAKVPVETLVKVFEDRVKTDTKFQEVIKNVVESKSASDPAFRDIVSKAKDGKIENTQQYKNFCERVTKDVIRNDPTYADTITNILTEEGSLDEMLPAADPSVVKRVIAQNPGILKDPKVIKDIIKTNPEILTDPAVVSVITNDPRVGPAISGGLLTNDPTKLPPNVIADVLAKNPGVLSTTLAKNPNLLPQVLDSPVMSEVLEENPKILTSSKAASEVLSSNPKTARQCAKQALADPSVLREYIASDPEVLTRVSKVIHNEQSKRDPTYLTKVVREKLAAEPEYLIRMMKDQISTDPTFFDTLVTEQLKSNPTFLTKVAKQQVKSDPQYLTRIAKEQIKADPQYLTRMVESDPVYRDMIMKAAKNVMKSDPTYLTRMISSDPVYRTKVITLAKEQMKSDPTYLTELIESDPVYKTKTVKMCKDEFKKNPAKLDDFIRTQLDINPKFRTQVASTFAKTTGDSLPRLEDHPEYNQYATDMRRECSL